MKLRSLLFICCLGLLSSAFAQNRHIHPQAKPEDVKAVAGAKNAMMPGYCEIEIINQTYENVAVYGQFDDGARTNFSIGVFDAPHYISLYYYNYCHAAMYLYAETYSGRPVLARYVQTHETVPLR